MSFIAAGTAFAGAIGATGLAGTLVTGLVTSVGSGLAGKLVGGVLGGLAGQPKTVVQQVPGATGATTMPLPDDQAAALAKKRSINDQMARRGRASTILTDSGSEKLGG